MLKSRVLQSLEGNTHPIWFHYLKKLTRKKNQSKTTSAVLDLQLPWAANPSRLWHHLPKKPRKKDFRVQNCSFWQSSYIKVTTRPTVATPCLAMWSGYLRISAFCPEEDEFLLPCSSAGHIEPFSWLNKHPTTFQNHRKQPVFLTAEYGSFRHGSSSPS